MIGVSELSISSVLFNQEVTAGEGHILTVHSAGVPQEIQNVCIISHQAVSLSSLDLLNKERLVDPYELPCGGVDVTPTTGSGSSKE